MMMPMGTPMSTPSSTNNVAFVGTTQATTPDMVAPPTDQFQSARYDGGAIATAPVATTTTTF